MNDIAVTVSGLGKKYRIGAREEGRRTLRETLTDSLVAPLRRARSLLSGNASGASELEEEIWALRDVTFQVPRGEVLGIIGRNGAGKSTLLKILSRITEPTEGFVEIRGRVGSLLEVGTGFHPELTGRENVYLNGAILGMRRSEIDRKFDEIVEFSGVEKFLDTPIKRYSSGMYVRLAFAVAAHLEPEILVVDEVLSVGDAEFQRKCLGKMGDVASSGRTVLFVSHNMGAVSDLCDRVILLEDGRIRSVGAPSHIIAEYLSAGATLQSLWRRSEHGEPPSEDLDVVIDEISVRNEGSEVGDMIRFDRPLEVGIAYRIREPVRDLAVLYGLENHRGLVWQSWDTDGTEWAGRVRGPGSYVSTCSIPAGLLSPGRYHMNVATHLPNVRMIEAFDAIIAFEVSLVGYPFKGSRSGTLTPLLSWDVSREGARSDSLARRLAGDGQ